MSSCSFCAIVMFSLQFMPAVERFSLGVRNPTAFLAGAMVSNELFQSKDYEVICSAVLHFECLHCKFLVCYSLCH